MNSRSNILRMVLLFVLAVGAQVLIFNDIRLGVFVNPYIYIIFILSMPIGTSRAAAMTMAFAAGITVDLFSNTPGMHAAACVLIAYLRPRLLQLIALNSEYQPEAVPHIGTYGAGWYMRYAAMMIVAHHLTLFFIEQFDTFLLWTTLLRILLSAIATFVMVMVVQPVIK